MIVYELSGLTIRDGDVHQLKVTAVWWHESGLEGETARYLDLQAVRDLHAALGEWLSDVAGLPA